ncbi:uncharacterized protein LOC108112955 [Drosophila eugracilis]|uniref:uncharacterized protein LOC108112955 n=1 Tax=Drosophila eugracilis TaxID=29029 RepID=UPI0007E6554C|nr:uncharacterized protein LOC108112955 [Drosophila eugracilis]
METEAQKINRSPSGSSKLSQAPVLNISGKVEPIRNSFHIKGKKKSDLEPPTIPSALEPLKINTTSFPVIISRILLKSDIQPGPNPKVNPADFEQNLCMLCMVKPILKKRVYHLFISNKNDLERDYEKVRQIYENRKDIKILGPITLYPLCARSMFHRVQNKLTYVKWNKQRNIFETERVGEWEHWNISQRLYQMEHEEREKLLNYAKFLSATNS